MFLGSLNQVGNFRMSGSLSQAGGSITTNTVPVQHVVIGSGDQGIYQTVRLIKQKAHEGTQQKSVQELVRSILAGIPKPATQVDVSKALVQWWMANIQYRHDDDMSFTERGLQWVNINQCPRRFKICEPVEMVSDVPQILAQRHGDCDDFVTGLGAFHSLAGIKWCPVIVSLDTSIPGEFSHIYLIANLDGSWVPIDAVNRGEPWGWQAPNPMRREVVC